MGCILGRQQKEFESVPEPDTGVQIRSRVEGIHEEHSDALDRWEKRQKKINDRAFRKMREEFFVRPDHFIANMLVLSTQFYKNFEQERNDISQIFRDEELSMNKLLSGYNRRIMFLGAHEVVAARHTLYHPRGKKYYEMPAYKQTYVIQVNADLFPESEYEHLQETEYLEMTQEHYRLSVEASNRHVGYVRLRSVDLIPGISRRSTCEDLYRSITPVEDEHDPNIDRRPPRRTKQAPELTGDSDEVLGDDEDKAMQYRLQERRLSGVMPDSFKPTLKADVKKVKDQVGQVKSDKLSPKKKQEYPQQKLQANVLNDPGMLDLRRALAKIEEKDEDSEDEEDEEENTHEAFREETKKDQKDTDDAESAGTSSSDGQEKNSKPDLRTSIKKECFISKRFKPHSASDVYHLKIKERQEKRTYLSSERYQLTFEDDFPDFLEVIKRPDIMEYDVEEPSMLIHEMTKNNAVLVNSALIPALHYNEFPPCATEWVFRERTTHADPLSKLYYKWPKDSYIQDIIHKYGCELLPVGYYNPNEDNHRIKAIEWQIQFVKAEQILMRSLGHQQIRVLLLVQLLLRDHLDEKESRTLKPHHLRYVLFSMCERNYRDWQEEQLAMNVKDYLKTLSNCLSARFLPHYFLNKVNLLDNMKEKSIRVVQECVQRIAENLPVYMLHTLRRLRTSKNFYPRLNLKAVYNLIKHRNMTLTTLHPNLVAEVEEEQLPEFAPSSEGYGFGDDKEEETEEHKKLQEVLMGERARLHDRAQRAAARNKTVVRKEKDNLVDLNIRVQNLNDLRIEKLLMILAEHFLKMAEFSNKFEAHPQAYKYVNFANNMLQLLNDEFIMYKPTDSEPMTELSAQARAQKRVTMQGLNKMLNMTHCLSENLEIKVANSQPPTNWTLHRTSELPRAASTPSFAQLQAPPPQPYMNGGHRGSRETVQLGILKTISRMENTSVTAEADKANSPVLVHKVSVEIEGKDSEEKPKKSKEKYKKKKSSVKKEQSSKTEETKNDEAEKITGSSPIEETKKTAENKVTAETKTASKTKKIEKKQNAERTKKTEGAKEVEETKKIEDSKSIEETKKLEETNKSRATTIAETSKSIEPTKNAVTPKIKSMKTTTKAGNSETSSKETSLTKEAKVKVDVQPWAESGARASVKASPVNTETSLQGKALPEEASGAIKIEKKSKKHKTKEDKRDKAAHDEDKIKNAENANKLGPAMQGVNEKVGSLKVVEDKQVVNQSTKTSGQSTENKKENGAIIMGTDEKVERNSKKKKESSEKKEEETNEKATDQTLAVEDKKKAKRKDAKTDEKKHKKKQKDSGENAMETIEKEKTTPIKQESKEALMKETTDELKEPRELKIKKRKEEKKGEASTREKSEATASLKQDPTKRDTAKEKTPEGKKEATETKEVKEKVSEIATENEKEKKEKKQETTIDGETKITSEEKSTEKVVATSTKDKKREKKEKKKEGTNDDKLKNAGEGKNIENKEEHDKKKREKKEKNKIEKERETTGNEAETNANKKDSHDEAKNLERKVEETLTRKAKVSKDEKPDKKNEKRTKKEESNDAKKKESKIKEDDTTKSEKTVPKVDEKDKLKKKKKETGDSTPSAKKSEKESKTMIEEKTDNAEKTK